MAAIHINREQFLEMIKEGKRVLVDYWAPWCGHCRQIEAAYEKIAVQYGNEMVVAKVNIDEEPDLAAKEQIEVIPTLVIYKGGQALASIVAPESKAQIEAFIKESLNL